VRVFTLSLAILCGTLGLSQAAEPLSDSSLDAVTAGATLNVVTNGAEPVWTFADSTVTATVIGDGSVVITVSFP
jgi:hypothetical protein